MQLCLVLEVEQTQILLVEDDPLNVEMFQLALNNYNFVNQIVTSNS